MKNSSIKSQIWLLFGAIVIITVSLSFTFSDSEKSLVNSKENSIDASRPIGGFSQDPK